MNVWRHYLKDEENITEKTLTSEIILAKDYVLLYVGIDHLTIEEVKARNLGIQNAFLEMKAVTLWSYLMAPIFIYRKV